MAKLYTNSKGIDIQSHSYSAGQEFHGCRRKYYLHRIKGYIEKDKKCALEMGKCLESAIQFYHENGFKPDDCVDEWKRLWLKWQEVPLKFTEQESDWASVYQMGADMARLYEIVRESLPIHNAKFQLSYEKSLWPGTEFSDLQDRAFIDMLSTSEDGERLIIDIKTSKAELNLPLNMLSLDPQLKRYAWISGILDVAFLWFVKSKPSIKKGDTVTLLAGSLKHCAGTSLEVVKYDKDNDLVYMGLPEDVRKMDEELDAISGKGATVAKEVILAGYLADLRIVAQAKSAVTKTRVQFVRAKIHPEDLQEIGQSVGHEMLQIKYSDENNFWPKDSSVRFPNTQCTFCCMRGICLHDDNLRDALVVQISPAAKPEPDWLDLEVE